MKKLYKSFRSKTTLETMVPRCACQTNCNWTCGNQGKATGLTTSSFTALPTGA
jgi:hypothetical protein